MSYDALVLILLFFFGYAGYKKGLIHAVLTLAGYMIGLWLAVKCTAWAAAAISPANKWMPFFIFICILILVSGVVHLATKAIRGMLKMILLKWVDNVAGMLIYVMLCTLLMSLFIFFLTSEQILHMEESQSRLLPLIEPIGPTVLSKADQLIPYAKDSFEILRNFFSQNPAKIAV